MTVARTASVRQRILELFGKHRAMPGAPFEEAHFLDFLLARPAKKRAVYDSFRGLRRLNAFLDEVQDEFAVCLSVADRNDNLSLTRLVERVQQLEQSPRGSLASLKNRVAAGPGWKVLVVADLLIVILLIAVRQSSVGLGLVAVLAVLVNGAFLSVHFRDRAYHARLQQKIENLQGARDDASDRLQP